jgi:hypothetical protein
MTVLDECNVDSPNLFEYAFSNYIEHSAENRIEKHHGTERGSGKSFNEKLHQL